MKQLPLSMDFCVPCSSNDEEEETAAPEGMVRSTLHIEGMCCASEVPAVRGTLKPYKIDINITTRTIYVHHGVSKLQDICDRLEQSGFPPTVLRDGSQALSQDSITSMFRLQPAPREGRHLNGCDGVQSASVGQDDATLLIVSHDPLLISDEEIQRVLLHDDSYEVVEIVHASTNILPDPPSLKWNVVSSGIFWIISMLAELFSLEVLEASTGIAAVVTGMPPVASKAYSTVFHQKRVDANVMMLIAATGAIVLGEWQEAASVAFLFSVSELLERRTTGRATEALSNVLNLQPEYGVLVNGRRVPAACIPSGTKLLVRPGDKIAADGIVKAGSAEVDQSSLTGESRHVSVGVSDVVKAGSIHCGNSILTIETTSTANDSDVSRLVRLVEQAATNRSETESLIDQFAAFYTPIVLFAAAVLATLPWLWGEGSYWTMNALILIVIACPCALTISTPVSYAAGLGAAAAQGIVVKGGGILEAVGKTTTVVLDKTGTLTTGKFRVAHLDAFKWNREDVLRLLLRIESNSSHPLAKTLVHAARREGIDNVDGSGVEEHQIIPGQGITAIVDGKKCYVGNQKLFDIAGISLANDLSPDYLKKVESWNECGTVGFVGTDDEGILACYSLMDIVRPEAKEILEDFHAQGIQVYMLTGDSRGAANSVARQVGLDEQFVHAQLLPEDKLHFVGSLKSPTAASFALFRKDRKVLFCGDGINDIPAMAAAADVGVAMGEGAAVAMEMSDIALMDSNLSKLQLTMKLGKKVLATVRENILISLVCKVFVTILTFAGYMTLFYAIVSDVGVMLLVTANGLKLLPTGLTERHRRTRRFLPSRYDPVSTTGSPTKAATELELI